MKNLLSIFMLIFLCTGCYSSYLTQYDDLINEVPAFTKIPIKPTGTEVKIIFPGEKIAKPYIRVDIFEVTGDAYTPTKELIKNLKLKGKLRGVDALVLMGNNTFPHDDGDYVTSVKSLSALGIKYIENIDYLDNCIKQIKVVAFNKQYKTYETTAVIKTDWKGVFSELEEGNPFFWDFLYNYSDNHLLLEKVGWSYSRRVGMNGKIYLTRVLTGTYNFSKKVEVTMFKDKIETIDITDNVDRKYSGKIIYQYKDGQFSAKEIESKAFGKYLLEYTFSEDNLPLRYDVYKVLNGKKEFYFKAIFERYDQEDLEQLLAQEDVQMM